MARISWNTLLAESIVSTSPALVRVLRDSAGIRRERVKCGAAGGATGRSDKSAEWRTQETGIAAGGRAPGVREIPA
ncbi:hypothetical protein GCM10010255_58530 [Streptomyces coeruleofuscus]|uniref:Uncharacterized protein n=1 Tax=Streptomyces coeruleofuscus TaxID=66879 RepID=A0ABP5VY91_9ACTN